MNSKGVVMPPQLSLHFLGPPEIFLDDALVLPSRRMVTALLAYLSVNKSICHTREYISSLFWPEHSQVNAFTNLRHTLWELHKSLGDGWIISDHSTVRLNPDAGISVDVTRFQEYLNEARHQPDPTLRIPLLLDTVSIYRDHFLTGFHLKCSPDFNDWVFSQADYLHNELVAALTLLVESYCQLEQPEAAIPHAQRLITTDPLNESAYCHMMNVYLRAGQYTWSMKQCQLCNQIMRKEFGITHTLGNCNLYQQIIKS